MRNMKCQMTLWIEQLNQEKKIRTFREKETDKYLRLLEGDIIEQKEMKEKIKKDYLGRRKNLLKTKQYRKKIHPREETKVVPFVRFSGPFHRTNEKIQQMVRKKKRKLMTIH